MNNAETRESELHSGSIQGIEDDQREQEELMVVADLLKRTREGRGISLKDAETETRIPTHYLQILEGEGDSRLLAEVLYLIPFLRTYSLFLGLDPADTVPQFIAGVQKGEMPSSVLIPQPRRMIPRAALILLLLGGVAVFLFLWSAGGRS